MWIRNGKMHLKNFKDYVLNYNYKVLKHNVAQYNPFKINYGNKIILYTDLNILNLHYNNIKLHLHSALVNQLRRWEKETYLVTKELQEDPESESLNTELQSLEQQVFLKYIVFFDG